MPQKPDHYLKDELEGLFRSDPTILQFLTRASLDGLWYWDLESPQHEWLSDCFWELMGYNPDTKEHLASEWQELIHPDDLQAALENFRLHCADPAHPYDQVVRYLHRDGSTVWVRCRGLAIRDADGKAVRMLGAHNDITELKKAQEELRQRTQELERLTEELERHATRDSLTGLRNRRVFLEHAEWMIKNSYRRGECSSLLLIDLDGFKKINDTFGHSRGDAVLERVASVLATTSRETDFLARYGGEEFAVALQNTDRPGSLIAAERLRHAIEQIDDLEVPVTASIGASTHHPTHSANEANALLGRLIEEADRSLYCAKDNGRNRVQHFESIGPSAIRTRTVK